MNEPSLRQRLFNESGTIKKVINGIRTGHLGQVLNVISTMYYHGFINKHRFWQIINVISRTWKNN